MPYIKQTIRAGKTIEVHKHYSARYGKGTQGRKKHQNKTSEKAAEVNRQQAIKKLRGLLNANFVDGDIHAVFTYAKDKRPSDSAEAKKEYSKLLRELKKAFAKANKEFKYVSATEYKNKAIHHHFVLPNIDVNLLRKAWKNGKVLITVLDTDGQYGNLAEYFVKETEKTAKERDGLYKKRWNASQNLTKPIIITEIINARAFRAEPKAIKGYRLWKEKGCNFNSVDEYGLLRQSYIMVRLE
ncbi:MAG: hypothetical protein IJO24_06205 [Clostridia bacterium]|nr:hypothetical protein [Clostridia bacterium]